MYFLTLAPRGLNGASKYTSWIISVGLCLVVTRVQGRATLNDEQKDAVRNVMETIRSCRHIPGMTLSVVTSDEVLWKTAFGVSDVENNERVTTQTLFPIGSTTKAFTSTLLAQLLDKHKPTVNWDTPIVNILGSDFQLYNKTLTDQISLRDLLSHRTGIPGYFVPLMAGFPEGVTRKELVRKLRYFEPTHQIRTTFQYNNYMYMLAGYVAEVLEGEDWEHMNTERIFKPLGMTSSIYVRDVTEETNMAEAYTAAGNSFIKVGKSTLHQVDVAGPAGAIVSNAEDMTHWLQFNLRNGKAPSGEYLLPPDSLKETYSEQMAAPRPMADRDLKRPKFPISDIHAAYDLGWMTNYYRGYKRIWHSGGITTYKSMVWLYPDADIGIYLSANGPPGGGGTWGLILALHYLSDLLLGADPWLDAATLCSFPAPWGSAMPEYHMELPNHPVRGLSAYLGTYRHPGYSDVIVTQKPNAQTLELRMGRYLEAHLSYNRSNEIFYTQFFGELWYAPERLPVKFVWSDVGGGVEGLEIPFYSPYDTAKPVKYTKYSTSSTTAAANSDSCRVASPNLPLHLICVIFLSSSRVL